VALNFSCPLDIHAGECPATPARNVALYAFIVTETVFDVAHAEGSAFTAWAGNAFRGAVPEMVSRLNPLLEWSL
jgi:hypothetical protein